MEILKAKRGVAGTGLMLLIIGGLFLAGQILSFTDTALGVFWITILLGPIPAIMVVLGFAVLCNHGKTLVWVDESNLTVVKTNRKIPLNYIKMAVIRKHGYFRHGLASAWLKSIDIHLKDNNVLSINYVKDANLFIQQLNSIVEKSK